MLRSKRNYVLRRGLSHYECTPITNMYSPNSKGPVQQASAVKTGWRRGSIVNSWKLLHLTFNEHPSFLVANQGNPFTPHFPYLPVSFYFTFIHFLLFF